jgi:hypothetical protein
VSKTADIKAALLSRYAGEAWALLWEVADATGRNKCRSADAIAMSLWPSRGLRLHGHEVKASRTDWLKELKSPQKAESICRYCDHWWVVAGDSGIVRDGELPPTWGLLVLKGRGLVQEVAAPLLTPLPVDRDFLAGLLRASTKAIAKEDAAVQLAAYQKGYAEGRSSVEKDNGTQEALDKLTENVRRFEELSGVRISRWSGQEEEARRVKEVIQSDRALNLVRQQLDGMWRASRNIYEVIEKVRQLNGDKEPRHA